MSRSFPFRRVALLRRGWSATGGAEAYLLRLSAALAQAGVELRLFGSGVTATDWPHGEIVSLPGSDPLVFARAFAAQPRCEDELLFSLERVPDCHVFRAGDGVHAAWLRRRRLFSPWWKNVWRGLSARHRQLLRLEAEVFDPGRTRFLIANSRLVLAEILAENSFPAERIAHIPNGVPHPTLPEPAERRRLRTEIRASAHVPEEAFVVLLVGSGWERKGLHQAIRMIDPLPDAHLLVAGKGPARRFQHPRVHHLGPQRDLRPAWFAADAFLLPTWYDPFSNASLEALAAGLPVITTRDNGCAEVLTNQRTGSILRRADAIEEGTTALRFWQTATRENATSIAEECRAAAAPWTVERNMETTLEVLTRAWSASTSSAHT
jgi:UDP-glucose:(heptosyl)LPS alpha-1,3-glucosyltransferase